MGELNSERLQLKKLKVTELSLFSYQLSLVLRSGMPYLEGIQLFSEEIAHPKLKRLALWLYEDVKDGKKLHESFKDMGIFPEYFVQMTKIAETTGTVDSEMEKLSVYYDRAERLTYQLRNAITYPLILLFLMTAIIVLLIVKVFPVFQEVITSLGGDIPASTAVLFDLSAAIQNYAAFIFALVVLVVIVLGAYFKTTGGRMWRDQALLNLPYLKTFFRKLIASKLSQSLSLLIKSGIPLEEALILVAPTLDNAYACERLVKAQGALKQGDNVVQVLETLEILPQLFIKMLNVGHKTGETDLMLSKLNQIYDTEVDRFLQNATGAIEPTLVVILSIVVGAILLTVMLPLISIMASIG